MNNAREPFARSIGPNPGAAPPGAGCAAISPMRSGSSKIEQNAGTAPLPSWSELSVQKDSFPDTLECLLRTAQLLFQGLYLIPSCCQFADGLGLEVLGCVLSCRKLLFDVSRPQLRCIGSLLGGGHPLICEVHRFLRRFLNAASPLLGDRNRFSGLTQQAGQIGGDPTTVEGAQLCAGETGHTASWRI
jgi:hypothetical protein